MARLTEQVMTSPMEAYRPRVLMHSTFKLLGMGRQDGSSAHHLAIPDTGYRRAARAAAHTQPEAAAAAAAAASSWRWATHLLCAAVIGDH